ncbi:hypothetical protein [Halostella litorea]|uniref:hypothetical protein n=1 Tax=Halostella litorea TaxID=2528831 RepID=UPI0010933534|nr:hypothetical protein [Halostella litorea]
MDLRNVYSRTDHSKEDRVSFFSTIDEELDLEEIFNENDFSKLLASKGVNLTKMIEEGDIAFFASKSITTSELDTIHDNQDEIESNLGDPNLKELANMQKDTIEEVIAPYLSDPSEVAESIIEEASIWSRELYE